MKKRKNKSLKGIVDVWGQNELPCLHESSLNFIKRVGWFFLHQANASCCADAGRVRHKSDWNAKSEGLNVNIYEEAWDHEEPRANSQGYISWPQTQANLSGGLEGSTAWISKNFKQHVCLRLK